jgi:hypothetical protein
MKTQLSVIDSHTVEIDLAQLAAANNQEGIAKILGESKPDHRILFQGLQGWPYGPGGPKIAFMDDLGVKYARAEYSGYDYTWAESVLDKSWSQAKAIREVFDCWELSGQPRNIGDLAEELTQCAGLFCYATYRGSETEDLKTIARNFARELKRPVGWFCDERLNLQEIRNTRAEFKDLPSVTVFADGGLIRQAFFEFAETVRKTLPPRLDKTQSVNEKSL